MQDLIDLSRLQTEAINPHTAGIDQLSTLHMCMIINDEDCKVPSSVTPCLPSIAEAIDALVPRVRGGGRVIYIGAGTSGRLGILDASEIPPTFAAPPSQFVGLIAGGDAAIRQAQEGAEDSVEAAEADLKALQLTDRDSVIGIAASGRTPYVLGGLSYAKRIGCLTIGVACAVPSSMSLSGDVDFMIAPLPGPEVVAGSTRLKAGTATKLVLNMLSTGTMIKIGKTYGNMMVDLVASNAKLKQRSRNILRQLSKSCSAISDAALNEVLQRCNWSVKLALLVSESGLPTDECRKRLEMAGGVLATTFARLDADSRTELPVNGDQQTGQQREYVLCVDGGGSKCAAVIANRVGIVSRGVAGPSNMTDRGANATMETILTAAKQALGRLTLSSLPDKLTESYIKSSFASVWVGLAGMDRPGYRDQLGPLLARSFGLADTSAELRVTNDVDLLAAAMRQYPDVMSAVVVIAGTGSVCMRYMMTDDCADVVRVARSGGWGHLLGDEGAGYAMGREAIKHTLSFIEDQKLGLQDRSASILERGIMEYFGFKSSDCEATLNLLSEILASHPEQSVKSRIAGTAQVVLTAASSDKTAADIILSQATHLVDNTLRRLLDPRCRGYVPPEQSGLILSGSIMLNDTYQAVFRQKLSERRIQFRYVQTVTDAAAAGAEYLASANWHSS